MALGEASPLLKLQTAWTGVVDDSCVQILFFILTEQENKKPFLFVFLFCPDSIEAPVTI